jgi:hypothetical protein
MPEHELTAKAGFAVVPSVERAGLYHVRWSEPHVGQEVVPANLTSEVESDIRPRPVTVAGTDGQGTTTNPGRSVDAHREYVTWLALLAALVIAFDVWWLTRGPRGGPRPPAFAEQRRVTGRA